LSKFLPAFPSIEWRDPHYCTNKVESTNDNINDWLGRSQKLSFPVTNQKIEEEYVRAQQQEFEVTIYGNGPYDISESTESFFTNLFAGWRLLVGIAGSDMSCSRRGANCGAGLPITGELQNVLSASRRSSIGSAYV
jgi:hypothetical protein